MELNEAQKETISKLLSGTPVEDDYVELLFLSLPKPVFMIRYKDTNSIEYYMEVGNNTFKAYINEDGKILYIQRVGKCEDD